MATAITDRFSGSPTTDRTDRLLVEEDAGYFGAGYFDARYFGSLFLARRAHITDTGTLTDRFGGSPSGTSDDRFSDIRVTTDDSVRVTTDGDRRIVVTLE